MKIICLGDSFTRGFGVSTSERWIQQVSLAECTLINSGINGDTTGGMLARFHFDVVDKAPKYVLITGGTNDFISGSGCDIPQSNLMSMAHQAFHHNIIPIIGISPGFAPDAVRSDWFSFSNFDLVLQKQLQFNGWIKNFCHTFGIFSIDFYTEFEKIKETHPNRSFYIDGLHLTPEGHRIISEIATQSLKSIITI